MGAFGVVGAKENGWGVDMAAGSARLLTRVRTPPEVPSGWRLAPGLPGSASIISHACLRISGDDTEEVEDDIGGAAADVDVELATDHRRIEPDGHGLPRAEGEVGGTAKSDAMRQ